MTVQWGKVSLNFLLQIVVKKWDRLASHTGCILTHFQYSWDRLHLHCNPDEDKVVTEDEWMFMHLCLMKFYPPTPFFLFYSDERFAVIGGGSLQIVNVTEDDGGTYSCQADNGNETIETQAELNVQGG